MSQVDQSTVRQMIASKLVTAPSRVRICVYSINERNLGSGLPAAKEAAQMFAPANVRRQRVTFTQRHSVA